MSPTRPRSTSILAGDNTNKMSISFVCRQQVAPRQRPPLLLHRQLRQPPLQPLRRALLLPLRQGRRLRRDPALRPGSVLHRDRDRDDARVISGHVALRYLDGAACRPQYPGSARASRAVFAAMAEYMERNATEQDIWTSG